MAAVFADDRLYDLDRSWFEANQASLEQLAQNGDSDAMFILAGLHWRDGFGYARNPEKSVHFLEQAAELGHLCAQLVATNAFMNGWGGSVDYGKVKRFREMAKANDRGVKVQKNSFVDAHVFRRLGVGRFDPWGGCETINPERDGYAFLDDEPFWESVRAATVGSDAEEAYSIGMRFFNIGRNEPAFFWFHLATSLGHADATCRLGIAYASDNYHTYYMNTDQKKSLQLTKAAADLGSKACINRLQQMNALSQRNIERGVGITIGLAVIVGLLALSADSEATATGNGQTSGNTSLDRLNSDLVHAWAAWNL